MNDNLTTEVSGALAVIIPICTRHGCWVVWDDSDPWNRQLSIDGPSHEALVDCAEAIEAAMERIDDGCPEA